MPFNVAWMPDRNSVSRWATTASSLSGVRSIARFPGTADSLSGFACDRTLRAYSRGVPGEPPIGRDQVRTAEVIASLSLATDLGMGLPFEHGLQSTLFALRLAEALGVDSETASATYYGCLLFYIGCTADAEINAELFDEGTLLAHFTPVMFGTSGQTVAGIMRALAGEGNALPVRTARVVRRLPRAVRGHQRHITALCEVAEMLTDRLGLPRYVRDLSSTTWVGSPYPRGSGRRRHRLPQANGNGSACTPITRSVSCAPPSSSPPSHRRRVATTSGSTERGTTEVPRRPP